MNAPTIGRKTALDDLTGTVCKGCGGEKTPRMAFCRRCYFGLPQRVRVALHRRLGEGYEAAYSESLELLRGAAEAR